MRAYPRAQKLSILRNQDQKDMHFWQIDRLTHSDGYEAYRMRLKDHARDRAIEIVQGAPILFVTAKSWIIKNYLLHKLRSTYWLRRTNLYIKGVLLALKDF